MSILNRYTCIATLFGIAAANAAFGQLDTVNSAVVTTHFFNDIPTATSTVINNYPSFVFLQENHVSTNNGSLFANRDLWQYSSNGSTPYTLGPTEHFSATVALTLTASSSPTVRKEAGFIFSTGSMGDIQFIVDTDAHEVVQFGGVSFFAFAPSLVPAYTSGTRIVLGLTYFQDPANGDNALQFSANGINSPVFDLNGIAGNGSLDIGGGSTIGGYFQIVNDPSNPNNGGYALFDTPTITPLPEPSVFALGGFGILSVILARRRK